MQRTIRLSVALGLISALGGGASCWAASSPAQGSNTDEKLFEWCLSYFPEADKTATLQERPIRTLPPFTMEGVSAPSDLVRETVVVGHVPDAIMAYRGLWISPVAAKSIPLYAAYVERLTPTEMTIALLYHPPEDLKQRSASGLRQKLRWDGVGFEGETSNLMGIKGKISLRVQVSPFGEALGLGWANEREAFLLGCLISTKHY